jgi:hypothetical protein
VSEQHNDYDLNRHGEQTLLAPLREAKIHAIGFTWIIGGTEEEPPLECVSIAPVRLEVAPSGTKATATITALLSLIAFQVGRNGGGTLVS